MPSYYETLGVNQSASADDIKKAYRKLAMENHPDRHGGDKWKEAKFKAINEAYSVLSDESKKSNYDRFGSAEGPQGFGGFSGGQGFGDIDLGDIFGSFFGGDMGASQRSRRTMGESIELEQSISFAEAYSGVKKTLKYRRKEACVTCHSSGVRPGTEKLTCRICQWKGVTREQVRTVFGVMSQTVTCNACGGKGYTIPHPCSDCRWTGKQENMVERSVEIPAGIEDGMTLRVRGAGHSGEGGDGDLLISVNVPTEYEGLTRDGVHLYYSVPLSIPEVVLGGEKSVSIPLIGEKQIDIESGTLHGTQITLKGLGMPRLDRDSRGNVILTLEITVPRKLSRKEKELYEELRNESAKKKGIFGSNFRPWFDQ